MKKLDERQRDIDEGLEAVRSIITRFNTQYKKMQHKVELFGSQRFNLATKNSDLDIVLFPLYQKKKNVRNVLERMAKLVDQMGDNYELEVIEEIYTARTPIVILKFRGSVDIDISIAKGRDSTQAANYILSVQEKHNLVRPFLLCLKGWAKQTRICDAFNGTVNSYCWVNIGIWFLKHAFGRHIRQVPKNFHLGDVFTLFFFTLASTNFEMYSLKSSDGTLPNKRPGNRQFPLVVVDPITNTRNLATPCQRHGIRQILGSSSRMMRKLR
eukprot:UN34105